MCEMLIITSALHRHDHGELTCWGREEYETHCFIADLQLVFFITKYRVCVGAQNTWLDPMKYSVREHSVPLPGTNVTPDRLWCTVEASIFIKGTVTPYQNTPK